MPSAGQASSASQTKPFAIGQTTQWPCPAKLNLFIQIVGQKDNGYHKLQSVFTLLDYGDTLSITLTEQSEISLDCNLKDLCSKNNLIIKAAHALRDLAKKNHQPSSGVHFVLDKKLPVGGGIGGGSSNCATALLALNYLWSLNLSIEQLAAIGLTLGADVPFFIHGKTAFVEGVGEVITPIQLKELHYLVVHPNCHISTAEIFSHPQLTRNSKAINMRDLDTLGLPGEGKNCFQAIVCQSYPTVKNTLDWLQQYSSKARLTGTGSCLFLPFDNQQEMSKIASRCGQPHFVAKGVNLSPVHVKLASLTNK